MQGLGPFPCDWLRGGAICVRAPASYQTLPGGPPGGSRWLSCSAPSSLIVTPAPPRASQLQPAAAPCAHLELQILARPQGGPGKADAAAPSASWQVCLVRLCQAPSCPLSCLVSLTTLLGRQVVG